MRLPALLLAIGVVSAAAASAGRAHAADQTPRAGFTAGAATGIVVLRDIGGGAYSGPIGLLDFGYQLRDGLRPELRLSYASFAGHEYAPLSNLLFLSPGLRWQLPHGSVRPWIGAHLDVGTFSFGATCVMEDRATFGPPPSVSSQRGCGDATGMHAGFDLVVGVEWMLSPRIGLGAQLGWTYSRPTNPPQSEPAPPGYPTAPELTYVRTWVMLAAGVTLHL